MSLPLFKLNNVGDVLTINCGMDVSSAIAAHAKQMVFRKPDGTEVAAQDAVFSTNGLDGLIKFTTNSGFKFDAAGPWMVEAVVVLSGGTFRSLTPGQFYVLGNFEAA